MNIPKGLKDFQLNFSNYILDNESSLEDSEALLLYKNNYLFTLIDQLSERYPTLIEILGRANFNFFSRKYVLLNPSRLQDISSYGEEFPSFISKQSELKHLDFLLELASLDLFWHKSLNENEVIDLPKGLFAFWNAVREKKPLDDLEVFPDIIETISTLFIADELVLKCLHT
ncbi:MAG: hypothetical protein ACI9QD_000344 [Thermoproteota archaeon]|jgi:hypothetical protein